MLLFQLAERFYGLPGLASRLQSSTSRRNVRPKSAELVALLQAGELDYAWMYESSARGARLAFLSLPTAIDLSDEAMAAHYDSVGVRVLGGRVGDTLVVRGTPIRYAVSIPRRAEHVASAEAFLQFLFSATGRRVLRGEFLDALEVPLAVGEGMPAFMSARPIGGEGTGKGRGDGRDTATGNATGRSQPKPATAP